MSAYTVQERDPRRRSSLPKCAVCNKTVETWAIPLDVRVPALCDKCARENLTR